MFLLAILSQSTDHPGVWISYEAVRRESDVSVFPSLHLLQIVNDPLGSKVLVSHDFFLEFMCISHTFNSADLHGMTILEHETVDKLTGQLIDCLEVAWEAPFSTDSDWVVGRNE